MRNFRWQNTKSSTESRIDSEKRGQATVPTPDHTLYKRFKHHSLVQKNEATLKEQQNLRLEEIRLAEEKLGMRETMFQQTVSYYQKERSLHQTLKAEEHKNKFLELKMNNEQRIMKVQSLKDQVRHNNELRIHTVKEVHEKVKSNIEVAQVKKEHEHTKYLLDKASTQRALDQQASKLELMREKLRQDRSEIKYDRDTTDMKYTLYQEQSKLKLQQDSLILDRMVDKVKNQHNKLPLWSRNTF